MLDRETLEQAMQMFGKTQEPIPPAMLSALLPKRPEVQCAYCSYKYTLHSNLRRHVKIRHLGFRFPCANCSAESNRREDIIRHYQYFHPDKVKEADNIREVSKVTPDGLVMPLGRAAFRKRRSRSCTVKAKTRNKSSTKRSARVMARELEAQLKSADLLMSTSGGAKTLDSSPQLQASLPAEVTLKAQDDTAGDAPQRVIIALDPVTQFRLERVVAERVDRITERSVIETLDGEGRVTRRETVEREYFLNQHELPENF